MKLTHPSVIKSALRNPAVVEAVRVAIRDTPAGCLPIGPDRIQERYVANAIAIHQDRRVSHKVLAELVPHIPAAVLPLCLIEALKQCRQALLPAGLQA